MSKPYTVRYDNGFVVADTLQSRRICTCETKEQADKIVLALNEFEKLMHCSCPRCQHRLYIQPDVICANCGFYDDSREASQ